jgi:hypothetical protein
VSGEVLKVDPIGHLQASLAAVNLLTSGNEWRSEPKKYPISRPQQRNAFGSQPFRTSTPLGIIQNISY